MSLHVMRVLFISFVLHALTDLPLKAHRNILKSILLAPVGI